MTRFAFASRVIGPLLLGGVIAIAPVPDGLAPAAWHYFALFVTIITLIITEPIPAAALGLAGVTAAAVLGLVRGAPGASAQWALSGFGNTIVWLIFAAFMFTVGYAQTGLGRRIALHLVRLLGHRTLGLGYAVTLAELAFAPFTPSATARSAGTRLSHSSRRARASATRSLARQPPAVIAMFPPWVVMPVVAANKAPSAATLPITNPLLSL